MATGRMSISVLNEESGQYIPVSIRADFLSLSDVPGGGYNILDDYSSVLMCISGIALSKARGASQKIINMHRDS
jgi:hypothetical protein